MTRISPETVLVEPPAYAGRPNEALFRLAPGQSLVFGRSAPVRPRGMRIPDPGVSRIAGEIRAADDFWLLSNFSFNTTYLVENPEGGGEHIKVPQRRLNAPIPFEFARLMLPASSGFVAIKVYASQHEFMDAVPNPSVGEPTRRVFALDETAKYFLVLVALCEPRLRDMPGHAVPTATQIAERLRPLPGCAGLTRSAVNAHLDYLAEAKLRLRAKAAEAGGGGDWTREALAATALRFDLVHEEHLSLLPRPRRP